MLNTIKYSDIRSTLNPFDLVLFSGSDVISSAIKFAEKRELKDMSIYPIQNQIGMFSHVGIIVTSDILDHPNVLPGKKYILESTASGAHGYGVPNIDGKTFIGVQIRDLDILIEAYLKPVDNKISIAKLINNPFLGTDSPNLKERFTTLYKDINGMPYDFNLIDLGCTIFEWCRRYRSLADRIVGSGTWLFCSELVAIVYKDFGILPATVDPIDISPMGYLGYTSPSIPVVPIVVKIPPTYIVVD